MSRHRHRPLSILKAPPPPKPQAPKLTPEQRLELDQIKGRRERAQWLTRFMSNPTDPKVH